MKEQFISIIIPCYNSAGTITKLLDSLKDIDYANYEVIVVDDASKDNSRELIKNYDVKLIESERNSGAANSRNLGAKHAKGDILLFLDADTVAEKNMLKEVNRFFQDNKDASCVLGAYSKEAANKGKFQSFKALIEYFWIKDLNKCDYFMPACGAVKKDVFNKVGGFNTNYKGADVEDFEFGYRLSKEETINLDKNIQVLHHFPNFKSCTKNYFKRCFLWTRLFLKRRKFDNVGTTSSGGISSISAFFSLASLVFVPIFTWMVYPTIIFFSTFLFLNRKFYNYVRKEKGAGFTFYSILVLYVLSIIISTAAITSILTLPFKNVAKRWIRE